MLLWEPRLALKGLSLNGSMKVRFFPLKLPVADKSPNDEREKNTSIQGDFRGSGNGLLINNDRKDDLPIRIIYATHVI